MSLPQFASFCTAIDAVPTGKILHVIEKECQIINDELMHERVVPGEDVLSILFFCRFLKAVVRGVVIYPTVLPVNHIVYYDKILKRLIEGGELPAGAKEQFNHFFRRAS